MATLLLPVAVQLFSEKPAAPPPAAGFFVLWPRPSTFEIILDVSHTAGLMVDFIFSRLLGERQGGLPWPGIAQISR